MLSVPTVQALILERVKPLGQEQVGLAESLGRVVAESVCTPDAIPAWSNSAMDGYAVAELWETTACLVLQEEVPAGRVPTLPLKPGFCTRVMTGAMVPVGTRAVVMQEQTTVLPGGQVQFEGVVRAGQFIREQGTFRQAGEEVIALGTVITPAEIGILASLNRTVVSVYRRPVVGILSTGDELVAVGQPVAPGHITDSNQPMLAALVTQLGAIPQVLGIARDTPAALREKLQCSVDFVLSSGGVSVGSYDYVEQVLEELGAQILVRQVNMKPGKPLTFAYREEQLYWGLPGNPVSSYVGFWLTVYPALRKAMGYPAPWTLPEYTATLTTKVPKGGDRRNYLRGRLFWQEGYYFTPSGQDNSGNFANLSGVNGFAVQEVGALSLAEGETVTVVRLPV